MPSARADEFRRAASRLGFRRVRQTGSHERWIHDDGRAVTIPIHGGREIGPPLFFQILRQLNITGVELIGCDDIQLPVACKAIGSQSSIKLQQHTTAWRYRVHKYITVIERDLAGLIVARS